MHRKAVGRCNLFTQCRPVFFFFLFDLVWHTCSITVSHTPYASLMIMQNKAPCGASLWRCSGFSCQGARGTIGGAAHTQTHTLTGGHFHTACLFHLCNPKYPEQLRSTGCWLHTLDDTLSLSGGTPDGAVNM